MRPAQARHFRNAFVVFTPDSTQFPFLFPVQVSVLFSVQVSILFSVQFSFQLSAQVCIQFSVQFELFYISVANALSIACQFVSLHYNSAPVAKLVDAPDLGSGVSRRVGSSPIRRTNSADYQQVTTYACENACDFDGYGLLVKQGHSCFFCFVRYVYIRLHTLISECPVHFITTFGAIPSISALQINVRLPLCVPIISHFSFVSTYFFPPI